MVNPILARLRQAVEAEKRGEWAGRQVPRVLQPITAPANLLGLAQEPFNTVGKTVAGEAALLAALAQVKGSEAGVPGFDPDSTATAAARLALAQGARHPGRAVDALRTGPDTGVAWLAGALEMAANPLNFVAPIGKLGAGLQASGKAPVAGRALQGAALAGEGVNRASILPLYLMSGKGRAALTAAPEWLRATEAAAPALRPGAAALQELTDTAPARQAANDALGIPGNVPRKALPLVGGKRQYGPVAPPPATIPPEIGPQLPALVNRPTLAEGLRGNVRRDELIPGIGRNGGRGVGPVLPEVQGPTLPPLVDRPTIDEALRGNATKKLGPTLPPLLGPPSPRPSQLPELYGRRGNTGKVLGPKLPEGVKPEFGQQALRAATKAGDKLSMPLTQPLDQGQRAMLDSFREVLADGREADVLDMENWLRDTMGVAPETIQKVKSEALRLVETERTANAIAAIEQSPYFSVFQHFRPDGSLKLRNPYTGRRLFPGRSEVWNLPESGYDEVAADALQPFTAGGHTQRYGDTLDDFWTRAQAAFKEYKGLRQAKQGASALADVPVTAPTPTAAERFADIIATRDNGNMGAYLASPDFFAKRLGITTQEAQGLIDDLVQRGVVGDAGDGTLAFRPKVPNATPARTVDLPTPQPARALDLPPLPDESAALADKAFGARTMLDEAIQAAYGDRARFAWPSLLKKLGAVEDDSGRIVTNGRDITENVLIYLDDHTKLTGRKAIDARYGRLAEDVLPLPDATPEQLDELAGASAIADTPKVDIPPSAGDIAAGGGGGGGMGITPAIYAPPRVAIGAGAGGIGGAVAGWQSGDTREEKFRNAVIGGSAGVVAGAVGGEFAPDIARAIKTSGTSVRKPLQAALDKVMPEGFILDDQILGDAMTAVQRARDEAGRAQPGKGGLGELWQKFAAQWSRQIVDTPKQLPQDATYRALVMEGAAKQEFPGLTYDYVRQFHKPISRERATGAISLNDPYNVLLVTTGHADLVARKGELIGTEFADAIGSGPRFGRGGSAVAGAIIGVGAGVRRVNPITAATGAIRGAFDLEWSTAMRHLIGTANDAFREAMATIGTRRALAQEAQPFLDDLARRGVDVTALRARGGLFSANEVRAIAGEADAARWAELSEGAIRSVGDRVAFLAGDFREANRTGAEKVIGKAVPFARWQIRATPVMAEIARRNPRATALVAGANVAAAQAAGEENLKDYQIGTIPVSTDTPLIGALARARLGGVDGTVRLDPLGAVIPYGAGMFAGGNLSEDATGYQRAAELAGRVGFQPSPLVQALAYVGGQDYRAPSSLSRTAGVEGLADTLPIYARAIARGTGHADLANAIPDLSIPSLRAGLDAGRELLSPVTGASVSSSDPETRRYAELVLEETGLPLAASDNREYRERMGRTDNPLWQRAVLQARWMAAAGNATGLVSPVTTMAQTEESAAAQAAGKLPYTDYEISQAPASEQAAMREANARAIGENPASATYLRISPAARRRQLMDEWEYRNARLKRYAPDTYAERRKAYAASLP